MDAVMSKCLTSTSTAKLASIGVRTDADIPTAKENLEELIKLAWSLKKRKGGKNGKNKKHFVQFIFFLLKHGFWFRQCLRDVAAVFKRDRWKINRSL